MTTVRQQLSPGMAEILSHELRNPLASVVAGVSLAYELTEAGDPRGSYLRQALSDLSRVSNLLTGYLELGQSGVLASARLDLPELGRKVAARYDKGAVTIKTSDPTINVNGDGSMLERMLENLLDNAFAMGATQCQIELSRQSDTCLLTISDNGPGVAPELRDQIFSPLVSGRGSSGIGLTIVKEIVEAHRGDIALTNSERGATFRVALPCLSS